MRTCFSHQGRDSLLFDNIDGIDDLHSDSCQPVCLLFALALVAIWYAFARFALSFSLSFLSFPESDESGRTLIDLNADTIDIRIKESIKVAHTHTHGNVPCHTMVCVR